MRKRVRQKKNKPKGLFFLTQKIFYVIIYIEKEKGGWHVLKYETLVQQSVEVIVDTCILYEGNCEECMLKDFCKCDKPIEYNK